MECRSQKSKGWDALEIRGNSLSGTLQITAMQFELDVELSLLLGVFKAKIEAEIARKVNLQWALALVPGRYKVI